MRLWSRVVVVFLLACILFSCSSNRNTGIDKSKQRVTLLERTFREKVDSCISSKHYPNTFYSKAAFLNVSIPTSHKLISDFYIDFDNRIISSLSLAFPRINVGRVCLQSDSVFVRSKFVDFDSRDLGLNNQMYFEDISVGNIPSIFSLFGESNFKKFDFSYNDDFFILSRSNERLSVSISLNQDFTINSFKIFLSNSMSLSCSCSDFRMLNGFSVPYELSFILENRDGLKTFVLNHRNIELNGAKSLSF